MKRSNDDIKIVLAEDDPEDAEMFELALNTLSIAIELKIVINGEQLLTLLKQFFPDIIFMDICMSSKNGIECIVEIRKDRNFDNTPIIMFTAHTAKKYIAESYSKGANFYLIKANTLSEMAEGLRKILSIDWKNHFYYPLEEDFVIGN